MLSIIIPTYNMHTTVEKSIRSALNQTVEANVFVVDDGSNDNTMSIVSRYRDITSLSYPKNMGMSHAVNSIIHMVDTEYFTVLGADDILRPDTIENWLKNDLTDVNYCRADFMTPTKPDNLRGRIIENLKNPKKIRHCHQFYTNDGRHIIDGLGCLFKKSSFIEAGMYDENLRHKEGGELLIRMALKGYEFKYFDFVCGSLLSKGKSTDIASNNTAIEYIKNKHR